MTLPLTPYSQSGRWCPFPFFTQSTPTRPVCSCPSHQILASCDATVWQWTVQRMKVSYYTAVYLREVVRWWSVVDGRMAQYHRTVQTDLWLPRASRQQPAHWHLQRSPLSVPRTPNTPADVPTSCNTQVTWLVASEVRSVSFGLVIQSAITKRTG